MIVDTSAIIAILRREPERADFVAALVEAPGASMSAASYVECAAVVDRLGSATLSRQLDGLLAELGIDIVDVTLEQAQVARAAYKDFGRGSGHPAGLNFGDCFAYALASVTGESLLFKGGDFGHTDLRPALEA